METVCAMNELVDLPTNRPLSLPNKTCPYCGAVLNKSNRTKEHVVGRRFVPRGTLNGQWNLIVWACNRCNSEKAALEDDISAITMQPDTLGRHATDDKRLAEEALRKALGSVSGRTGKLVQDSVETINLKGQLGAGLEIDFQFSAPPQIDSGRAYRLAKHHVAAFFYWATYDNESRRGKYWAGKFMPINDARKEDWGNELMLGFLDKTRNWDPRTVAITADGFFRIAIRQCPGAALWSSVVEWNQSFRVISAFGNGNSLIELRDQLPKLRGTKVAEGPGMWFRTRIEVALPDDKDTAFDC